LATTSERIYICQLGDIDDPGSHGFNVQAHGESIDGFIVHHDGQLHAYRNSCPHTGSPLDWVEHQFLDADQAFIQCAVHDARFMIDSGECIAGPCLGEHLQALSISTEGDAIYLDGLPGA